jgi:hypothetical protein
MLDIGFHQHDDVGLASKRYIAYAPRRWSDTPARARVCTAGPSTETGAKFFRESLAPAP